MSECREALPVNHVLLFIGAPILGQESITAAYDFCVKISGQFRPVICQTADTEVSAKKGRRKVYINDVDIYFIAIPAAFLCTLEHSTRIQAVMALRTHTNMRDVDKGVWRRVGGIYTGRVRIRRDVIARLVEHGS
jgi:hypothetical protein